MSRPHAFSDGHGRIQPTTRLRRRLLERGNFMPMPSAYDPITARLIESAGLDVVYSGGFVTGGKTLSPGIAALSLHRARAGITLRHALGEPREAGV